MWSSARRPRKRSAATKTMKDRYDFSKGKRGRVVSEPPLEKAKVKITFRLDEDLIDQFGAMADESEGKVGIARVHRREVPKIRGHAKAHHSGRAGGETQRRVAVPARLIPRVVGLKVAKAKISAK